MQQDNNQPTQDQYTSEQQETQEQLLQRINKLEQQKLQAEQQLRAQNSVAMPQSKEAGRSLGGRMKLRVDQVLPIFGACVVLIGIIGLIALNWGDMNETGQVFATLGLGIFLWLLGAGCIIFQRFNLLYTGYALHIISMVWLPVGFYVLLNALIEDASVIALLFAGFLITFIFYIVSYFASRKEMYIAVNTLFLTLTLSTALYWIFEAQEIQPDLYWFGSVFVVIGISYLLAGWAFMKNKRPHLPGLFYFFGTGVFLLGLVNLGFAGLDGDWYDYNSSVESILFSVCFPLFLFGFVLMSTRIKSTAMLVVTFLYLFAYLLRLAGYFVDSDSWAILLIIFGFIFIGLGYGVVHIKKNYIPKKDLQIPQG